MESSSGLGAKVAIPRLKQPDQQTVLQKPPRIRSEKVEKACNRCRKRSTYNIDSILATAPTSYFVPRCINCTKYDKDCIYHLSRRDRLREATHKSEVLSTLLEDIRGALDDEHTKRVDDALKVFENDMPSPSLSVRTNSWNKQSRTSSSNETDCDRQEFDEAHVSSSVSSNEDLDFLEEDVLEDLGSIQMGFMGRNSQIQWMRTLQRKLDQSGGGPSDMPYAAPRGSEGASSKRSDAPYERRKQLAGAGPLSGYYFYLDNTDINIDIDDPDVVPPVEIAIKLFESYQVAAHDPFRILDSSFEEKLQTYYRVSQRGGTMNVCVKWKAILNLVFAIGARFSHLVGCDRRADGRDHHVYMSRAVHFLGLNQTTTLICAPDISLIRATGLLSFYYLATGYVSRAWYMIGTSIRYAQAAGLHLRNEDPSVPTSRKNALAQLWWALHSIECVLTSVTGRPRVIARKDCTVPLPTTMKERCSPKSSSPPEGSTPRSNFIPPALSSVQSQVQRSSNSIETATNPDSFLNAYVGLDLIQHKVLSNLYSARPAFHSWKCMQKEISSLTTELNEWALQALPHGSFNTASIAEPSLGREQAMLHLCYLSVKIYITRPCLCRRDLRPKGQSEESAEFNWRTAEACVQAALDLALLLPESLNPDGSTRKDRGGRVYISAITVLLLELAQGAIHWPKDPSNIATCVEKLTRWLKAMESNDVVSERAYNIVCKMLGKHEQSREDVATGQWAAEMAEQPYNEPTAASYMVSQSFNDLDLQYLRETPDDISFSDNYYSQANSGNFGLNEPPADFLFGQAQLRLIFGNHFMTNFDQGTDYYGLDGYIQHGQQPPQ
ncbi:unnamed protein product [Alternaria alternata]